MAFKVLINKNLRTLLRRFFVSFPQKKIVYVKVKAYNGDGKSRDIFY